MNITLPKSILSDLNKYVVKNNWTYIHGKDRKGNPKHYKYNQEIAAIILYQIQQGTLCCDWSSFGCDSFYQPINIKTIKKLYINSPHYIKLFIDADIIICNNSYEVGRFSKEYRFRSHYYEQDIYHHNITHKTILKNIDKYKYSNNIPNKLKYQYNILNKISIDKEKAYREIEEKINLYMLLPRTDKRRKMSAQIKQAMITNVDKIADGQFRIKEDRFGRRHHNLTGISKSIRRNCITLAGETPVEIDITNSQPLFLSYLYEDLGIRGNNKDAQLYKQLVRSGQFYEYIQDQWFDTYSDQITRDEAKQIVFKCFYDKPRDKPVKRTKTNWHYQNLFSILFPTISQAIIKLQLNKGYRALAHKLQRTESKYMFNHITPQIECDYYTIHDSIVIPISQYNRYKDIYKELYNTERDNLYMLLPRNKGKK